jgi:hypothetical protein
MEREVEITLELQGEYIQANYPNPTPAPPPPAPWYPPQPPTSDQLPPQTHHTPPLNWYTPQPSRYTPRRPRFRPPTRPPRARRVPFENQPGHVTATRRDGFRATTRAVPDGSPRYVPPALRNEYRTPWRSQLQQTSTSKDWRDPPPHRDLPENPPKHSDSPNWRAPSPNRPTSFRNPSPPLQSPPAPPISPSYPPEMLFTPPKRHIESRLTFELVSVIKTTSEALQSIIRVTEKLLRQVNASRRLAHRPQKRSWSLHEDMHGNVVHSPPPTFPSGRGVSVTGSLEVSDPLA